MDLWINIYIKAVGAVELLDNAFYNLCNQFVCQKSSAERNADLKDKIIIVTGGNAGIGKATAQQLVDQGAHVVLACRSLERAQKAAQDIKDNTIHSRAKVDVRQLDLSSFKSIRNFAQQIGHNFDVLICNAGIMVPPNKIITENGLEGQFQVNFLGHWLLSNLLLQSANKQQDCKSRRIVMLSSMAHRAGQLRLQNEHEFSATNSYEPFKYYAKSKLAVLLGMREFQRRFDCLGQHHVAVACHPGLVATDMANGYFLEYLWPKCMHGIVKSTLGPLLPCFLISTQQSSQNVIKAVITPNEQAKGGYVVNQNFTSPSKQAMNEKLGQSLWKVSEQLVGSKFLELDS